MPERFPTDTIPPPQSAQLASKTEDAVLSDQESPYHEREFTRIVLEDLADAGALENPMPLWQEGRFARKNYKICGYSIPDDEERLTLISTVYTGDRVPRSLSHDEIMTACKDAIHFYDCSCKELYKEIEPTNTDASELARRIYEARKQIGVLRVIILSDGLTGLKSIDLKNALEDTRVVVDLFGLERLQRILGSGLTRDDIVVDVEAESGTPIPCLHAASSDGEYEAYFSVLPGSLLADTYEKYGTRLLELNVRAFLGVRGRKSVNAGLRKTIKDQPERFLAYNNGIVATVDSIETVRQGDYGLAIKSMRGLQIVNGGQTTASLHRARRQDRAPLDGVFIPAKIICAKVDSLDEMVSAVSKSANSQNTVQPADFSSNEPFHVAVETLANNTWLPDGGGRWFYERARGSYSAAELVTTAAQAKKFARETPKERRFSKTDLAKYLNAWNGYPYLVSLGSQKNFQHFMQSNRDTALETENLDAAWFKSLIAKAVLFRAVQKIVKQGNFPAFQANITAYVVALLSWRSEGALDSEAIWSTQKLSDSLIVEIRSMASSIDAALRASAGQRMVSEWAKKKECWDAIRDTSGPKTESVLQENDVIHDLQQDEEPSGLAYGRALEISKENLIFSLRDVLGRGEAKPRDELTKAVAEFLKVQRLNTSTRDEIAGAIRAGVRRGILANGSAGISLATHSITDYARDDLKEQFVASLPGRAWVVRSAAVKSFASWLGFRRVGPVIEDTTRSLINGLLRESRIEARSNEIRRI